MHKLLKQIPLFSSLSRRDIRFLAQIAKQLELPSGRVLFKEGELGNRLYIIAEGELEIIKAFGTQGEIVLRVCYVGEPIGEMSFLRPGGTRSATVRAKTGVRLIEIARDDFELFLLGRPGIAYEIARNLSQRLVDSENRFIRALAEKSRKLAVLSKLVTASVDDFELHEPTDSIREQAGDVAQIQINVLGKFQIFRSETILTEKQLNARLPLMFLKSLITRGAENVPRDLLIEDLWPGSPPDYAKLNFKVVLHRLRKMIGHPETGSPYVWYKRNLVTLNRGLVRLDLDEFLSLYKRARRAERAGDVRNAIAFGNSAIELYRGDYLEEELYTPWTVLKREEIRAVYIDILRRTAAHHENQGSPRRSIDLYKLIIKADPSLEEAYRKLMLTYSNLGMRTEAIRTYNECRRALDRELGVGPDELTISIYKRIMEGCR
jgi:DNA-binding SARP family transcriptional activator/CRP-like cAMP-binding protein